MVRAIVFCHKVSPAKPEMTFMDTTRSRCPPAILHPVLAPQAPQVRFVLFYGFRTLTPRIPPPSEPVRPRFSSTRQAYQALRLDPWRASPGVAQPACSL